MAVLQSLEPLPLVHALLARALDGGIGRLHFELETSPSGGLEGRVLLSQDGTTKVALNSMTLGVFQAMVCEIKSILGLPSGVTGQGNQLELERSFGGFSVLLRICVMPREGYEGLTVQILRGKALQFYRRHHYQRLGIDALTIALQLKHKLNEISDLWQCEDVATSLNSQGVKSSAAPALDLVIQALDRHITKLPQPAD